MIAYILAICHGTTHSKLFSESILHVIRGKMLAVISLCLMLYSGLCEVNAMWLRAGLSRLFPEALRGDGPFVCEKLIHTLRTAGTLGTFTQLTQHTRVSPNKTHYSPLIKRNKQEIKIYFRRKWSLLLGPIIFCQCYIILMPIKHISPTNSHNYYLIYLSFEWQSIHQFLYCL